MKYEELMRNQGNLIPVTEEMELPTGTLIGFCGRNDGKITAAYTVWSKRKNNKEIQFALNESPSVRPIIDNTFIRETISEFTVYVNDPPIAIQVNTNNPQSFQDAVVSLFTLNQH